MIDRVYWRWMFGGSVSDRPIYVGGRGSGVSMVGDGVIALLPLLKPLLPPPTPRNTPLQRPHRHTQLSTSPHLPYSILSTSISPPPPPPSIYLYDHQTRQHQPPPPPPPHHQGHITTSHTTTTPIIIITHLYIEFLCSFTHHVLILNCGQ